MSEISTGAPRLRLPLPVGQFSVNFCKNPLCKNFGVPANAFDRRGKVLPTDSPQSDYLVRGTDDHSSLYCRTCGTQTRIKSNIAVIEELTRHAVKPVRTYPELCGTTGCANVGKSPSLNPELFYRHGVTAKGRQRFRCKGCGKTVSVGPSTKRQRVTHKNALIFRLVVHKVSINSIAAITGLSAPTVHSKIRFIAEQCRRFSADRERHLADLGTDKWYLSTDRQDYLVNWHDRKERKTIQFTAIATACQRTGYVLACHPQYDPDVDLETIAAEVEAESQLKPAMRRYARIWTHKDYEKALTQGDGNTAREDQDAVEQMNNSRQLPAKGAIIHADYMMYGHFGRLREMLGSTASRYRFFMDADAGMDKACLTTWMKEIAEGRADIFQVTCAKNATIDLKEQAVRDAEKLATLAEELYPNEPTKRQACARYFRDDRLKSLPDIRDIDAAAGEATDPLTPKGELVTGRSRQLRRFVDYPFSTKSEPLKRVAFLTDRGNYDLLHIARLYGIASLHRVDNFFMHVRRRVAGLERGTAYPRRAERRWSLYAFYDPSKVGDMLDIVRCYVNFVQPSGAGTFPNEDGAERRPSSRSQTAAMRIGLAKGAVRIEDILYFRDGKTT